MLIPFNDCVNLLQLFNIKVNGVLHVGAHECEELKDYNSKGVDKIIWIEANQKLIDLNKSRGVKDIYCLAVDDEEGEAVFNITNNGQSSSLLDFGTHEKFISLVQGN